MQKIGPRGNALTPHSPEVLVRNSGPGVDWLMEKFDLDLSLV